MRIKCPVALCEWEGKPHQFAKHIEDYKVTWKDVIDNGFPRAESHERWANYFFKEIWSNPNLDDKTKWTNIAVAYVNQIKNQNRETYVVGIGVLINRTGGWWICGESWNCFAN